jgi:hypothetical protein
MTVTSLEIWDWDCLSSHLCFFCICVHSFPPLFCIFLLLFGLFSGHLFTIFIFMLSKESCCCPCITHVHTPIKFLNSTDSHLFLDFFIWWSVTIQIRTFSTFLQRVITSLSSGPVLMTTLLYWLIFKYDFSKLVCHLLILFSRLSFEQCPKKILPWY